MNLKPLSTDDGQTQKGHVYLLAAFMQPVIFAMAPGWGQVIAAMTVFIGLAFLSYKTVGNIPPEDAKIVRQKIEEMQAEELVEEGRN
jgi:hypothetical protein